MIYIMCGGKQARMGEGAPPKQLTPICGEPLVLRTIRQLRRLDSNTVIAVVAPKTRVWNEALRDANVQLTEPTNTNFLAEVLARSSNASMFLFGDVVWSDDALDLFVSNKPTNVPAFCIRNTPNNVTGRTSMEMYGFGLNTNTVLERVLSYGRSAVVDAIKHGVLVDDDTAQAIMERNCRPWALFHELQRTGNVHVALVGIGDYTDDIDTLEDVTNCVPKMEAAITADSLR